MPMINFKIDHNYIGTTKFYKYQQKDTSMKFVRKNVILKDFSKKNTFMSLLISSQLTYKRKARNS